MSRWCHGGVRLPGHPLTVSAITDLGPSIVPAPEADPEGTGPAASQAAGRQPAGTGRAPTVARDARGIAGYGRSGTTQGPGPNPAHGHLLERGQSGGCEGKGLRPRATADRQRAG